MYSPMLALMIYAFISLSITKWIQLHGGDDGLKSFFKKVYHSLAEGGAFILEIYSDEQKTKQTNVRSKANNDHQLVSANLVFTTAFR